MQGRRTEPLEYTGSPSLAWHYKPCWPPNPAVLLSLQIRSLGRFSVLEQGLLIHQLSPEDAGIYQCQGMEHTFSHVVTHYNLRIIGPQAMEVLTSRLSKSPEEAGSHHSTIPRSERQLHYQGYLWALGAPGTNLDEFCNTLQQRKRRKQRVWNQKWQQHHLESKKGRVRRQSRPQWYTMCARSPSGLSRHTQRPF